MNSLIEQINKQLDTKKGDSMDSVYERRNLQLLTIMLFFSFLFTDCKQNLQAPMDSASSGLTNCDSPGPENTPTTNIGNTNIAPENHMSQSFKAISPCIRVIEFAINTINQGYGGDTVTVTLFASDKNILFLGKQYVPEGFDGWLKYDILNPLSVEVGETLVVELQDSGKIVFGWKYSSDTYPDGTAIEFGKPYSNHDFLFRINETQ
jgi:hypothetical protein